MTGGTTGGTTGGMTRRFLVVGAVVVLAALAGLTWMLRGDDDAARVTHPDDRARSHDAPRPSTAQADPRRASPTPAPSAGATPTLSTGSGSSAKEYVIGDVRIRDHREGDLPPRDVPPSVHAPLGRKLPSRLTASFARKLREATATCTASVAPEARGPAPRLDGQIVVAIKDQQAAITSATFQPRDLTGDAASAVRQCLLDKAIGLTLPSGDEADVEGYGITLSLIVP